MEVDEGMKTTVWLQNVGTHMICYLGPADDRGRRTGYTKHSDEAVEALEESGRMVGYIVDPDDFGKGWWA